MAAILKNVDLSGDGRQLYLTLYFSDGVPANLRSEARKYDLTGDWPVEGEPNSIELRFKLSDPEGLADFLRGYGVNTDEIARRLEQ